MLGVLAIANLLTLSGPQSRTAALCPARNVKTGNCAASMAKKALSGDARITRMVAITWPPMNTASPEHPCQNPRRTPVRNVVRAICSGAPPRRERENTGGAATDTPPAITPPLMTRANRKKQKILEKSGMMRKILKFNIILEFKL